MVRGGKEIVTEKLAGAGPVNCCVAPSGGFDYTGTTAFDLQTGDVYGFRMSGSHFDRDRRLIGTLSLTPEQPAALIGIDTLIKEAQARIDALTAQIKQVQIEMQAASAAGDTLKAQQLMVQLQQLISKRNDADRDAEQPDEQVRRRARSDHRQHALAQVVVEEGDHATLVLARVLAQRARVGRVRQVPEL